METDPTEFHQELLDQSKERSNFLAKSALVGMVGLAALGVQIGSPEEAEAKYDTASGPNNTNRVILTYDDCPKNVRSYRKVLDYAKKEDIGLGIFPTGECYKQFKRSGADLADMARKRGQYVGNHSYSHPNLTSLSLTQIKRQIKGPVKSNYGRPPGGAQNGRVKQAYKQMGIKRWLWNVDTNDWKGKSRTEVVHYVSKRAKKGDTVLMHMQWNGFNPNAIGRMKRGLNKRNLKLCHPWRNENGDVARSPVNLPPRLPC